MMKFPCKLSSTFFSLVKPTTPLRMFQNKPKSATAEWSWNARFADLDNDQWQDLYVIKRCTHHSGVCSQ